jgi:hypothetical protein
VTIVSRRSSIFTAPTADWSHEHASLDRLSARR